MNSMIINKLKCLQKSGNQPKSLASWINHQTSLTDKLKSIVPSVELKRLSQQWICPSWWDTYCLQIDAKQLLQREIIMYGLQVAYWYARTIIPKPCYDLNPTFFNRLEQESLRNLLFDSHEVHRVDRLIYPVEKNCIEYHWVHKYLPIKTNELWTRLTEYSYQHQSSFYLMELLLPELGDIS